MILGGLFHPERYDARSGMEPAAVVEALRSAGVEAEYVPDVDGIVADLNRTARPGDVVLVMSNGGFGGIHGKLLEALGAAAQG